MNNWKFLKKDSDTLQTNPKARAVNQLLAILKKIIQSVSFQKGSDQSYLVSFQRKSLLNTN